jgi:hypothetical protein
MAEDRIVEVVDHGPVVPERPDRIEHPHCPADDEHDARER